MEVFQPWLEPAIPAQPSSHGHSVDGSHARCQTQAHSHAHSHSHGIDHGDHVHEARQEVEQRAVELEGAGEQSRLSLALVKVRAPSAVCADVNLLPMDSHRGA